MSVAAGIDVLLVVDMQQASVSGNDKHDIQQIVDRINGLAERVRQRGGRVVFIQHDGNDSEDLVPFTTGWLVVNTIATKPEDVFVRKTLNDSFAGTSLAATLREMNAGRILIVGWATDFCVDATVRSAVSHGFDVAVASNAHTLNDRAHLRAAQVIEHHNWVWSNLLSTRSVRVQPAETL